MKTNKPKLNKPLKLICLSLLASGTIALSGCAAIQTEVQHKDLSVNSKMSNSIFLAPVAPKNKTIYVSVKNTSDEQNVGLQQELLSALKTRGWKVTNNFTKAHDVLQVNILQAGKVKNTNQLFSSLSNGFGGAVAGSVVADVATGGADGAIGGVIGGAAGWIGGMFVKDVTYAITTDIQVQNKAPKGTKVHNTTHAIVQQGSSTVSNQSYSNTTNVMTYRARVISYADKVNLKFAEAKPKLSHQMAAEIANIF